MEIICGNGNGNGNGSGRERDDGRWGVVVRRGGGEGGGRKVSVDRLTFSTQVNFFDSG